MARFFVFNHNLVSRAEEVSTSKGLQRAIGKNLGNSYIGWSVCKALNINPEELQGVANVWSPEAAFPSADYINNNFDHVIFILQDQLRKSFSSLPFSRVTKLLKKIKLPFTVFSLGANAFDGGVNELVSNLIPDQISFYRLLSDRAKNLGVRGEFTASVLEKLNITNIKIHGCPTYFEMGPEREVKPLDYSSVLPILRTGACYSEEVQRHGIDYAFQCFEVEKDFIEFIYFGVGDAAQRARLLETLNNLPPSYAQAVFFALFEGKAHFFSTVEAWKELFKKSRFRMSVGTRVHGSIMALNSGVPAILINRDFRAREMADFLGIPYDPSVGPETTIEKIEEQIDIEKINRTYRLRFSEYSNWFCDEFSFEPNFKELGYYRAGLDIRKRERNQVRWDLVRMLPRARFISPRDRVKFFLRFPF